MIRDKDYFNRIVRNVRAFTKMQAQESLAKPRVSLWLAGPKKDTRRFPSCQCC